MLNKFFFLIFTFFYIASSRKAIALEIALVAEETKILALKSAILLKGYFNKVINLEPLLALIVKLKEGSSLSSKLLENEKGFFKVSLVVVSEICPILGGESPYSASIAVF